MLWTLGMLTLLIPVPGHSHVGALPQLTPDQEQLTARLHDHVWATASRPHNAGHL